MQLATPSSRANGRRRGRPCRVTQRLLEPKGRHTASRRPFSRRILLFLMDHVITVYGSWTDAGSGADGGEGNEDEAPEDPR